VVAKAVFGVLIWAIAAAKSGAMEKDALLNEAQQDTAMGA